MVSLIAHNYTVWRNNFECNEIYFIFKYTYATHDLYFILIYTTIRFVKWLIEHPYITPTVISRQSPLTLKISAPRNHLPYSGIYSGDL